MKEQKFTKKAIAEVKKGVNSEAKTVFGAVKALVLSDGLSKEGRSMLAFLAGRKFETSKAFRQAVADAVLDNTPIYTEEKGVRVAIDKVNRKAADGTTRTVYIRRTRWTAGKVLDCVTIKDGAPGKYIAADKLEA